MEWLTHFFDADCDRRQAYVISHDLKFDVWNIPESSIDLIMAYGQVNTDKLRRMAHKFVIDGHASFTFDMATSVDAHYLVIKEARAILYSYKVALCREHGV